MSRAGKLEGRVPAHVHVVRAKGRAYYYYQHARGKPAQGPRIALKGAPYSGLGEPDPEWWKAYRKAAGVLDSDSDSPAAPAGSFAALVEAYLASPEFEGLRPATKSDRSRLLGYVVKGWSTLPVRQLEPKHVLAFRDRFAKKPATANNTVRALSSALSWAVPRGWLPTNPCLGLKKLKGGGTYAPWSWEQIQLLRQHARPRMWQAAALALYSGQRQADVLKMRWSDIENDLMHVVQSKTGAEVWVPVHVDLKAVLGEMPRVAETILSTERGESWGSGFKASWQAQMDVPTLASLREAGLVFHGLRKSAVVFLLEAGCTDAEVSAITGQSREMVEHYARQVNRRKLAAAAILKWETASGR